MQSIFSDKVSLKDVNSSIVPLRDTAVSMIAHNYEYQERDPQVTLRATVTL